MHIHSTRSGGASKLRWRLQVSCKIGMRISCIQTQSTRCTFEHASLYALCTHRSFAINEYDRFCASRLISLWHGNSEHNAYVERWRICWLCVSVRSCPPRACARVTHYRAIICCNLRAYTITHRQTHTHKHHRSLWWSPHIAANVLPYFYGSSGSSNSECGYLMMPIIWQRNKCMHTLERSFPYIVTILVLIVCDVIIKRGIRMKHAQIYTKKHEYYWTLG